MWVFLNISLEKVIQQQTGACAILKEDITELVPCMSKRFVTCQGNGKYIHCSTAAKAFYFCEITSASSFSYYKLTVS